MKVFVAYFSQMGRHGCGDDPTFLLATLQKHISSWEGVSSVQTECFQAPGTWMPYLTDKDDETRIGEDVYSALGGTAFNPWHDLQSKYDAGDTAFLFVGASNGCIPAAFFAKQYADKTLSVTFLSCVPGREQWGDVARLHCPKTVTCGSDEKYFGGASSIYSFAQTVRANVFSFYGKHLYEGQEVLNRLASFVADVSKPTVAVPARPRKSPRQRKSKSPSAPSKSPSSHRRARRTDSGKKSASPRRRKSKSPSSSGKNSSPRRRARRADAGGKKSPSPKRG